MSNLPSEKQIRRTMRSILNDDIYITATELVEQAADYLDINFIDGPLDDPDHPIWDWAVEEIET